MARFLSKTLLHHAMPPPISATSIIHHHYSSSSQFKRGEIIEIDLDPSSDSDSAVEITAASGIKKLEDIVQRIIVRRSQPAWLPFVPGTSYWVPPMKKPGNFAEVLGRLANPLSEEEALSLTTVRGWPCSSFFINAPGPKHIHLPMPCSLCTIPIDSDAGVDACSVVDSLKDSSTDLTEVEAQVETEVPDSLQEDSTNISKSD